MAMLALASYWLLQATPPAPTSGPERTETHQPHHLMQGFSVRTHGTDGGLRTEVLGREARLFPDDGSMEMDDPRVRSFSPEGVLTVLSARQGWTNKAQDEFVLRGDARVLRQPSGAAGGRRLPALEFQGQHLRVFTSPRRVVANEPVLLLRGADRISAQRMDYDDVKRVAIFTGRVRAQLVPRPQP